jgi:Holliday junction resolvase
MSRGIVRERQLKALLQAEDWWVIRAAGSLGDADLVALRDGDRPQLIEVKSDIAGPYAHFGPAARAELKLAAGIAGATPWLVWWPPRAQPRWIAESEWPR